jgi:hypothetical protein
MRAILLSAAVLFGLASSTYAADFVCKGEKGKPIPFSGQEFPFSWQEKDGAYSITVDGASPFNAELVNDAEVCTKSGLRSTATPGKGNIGVLVCFATQGYADLSLSVKGKTLGEYECRLKIK